MNKKAFGARLLAVVVCGLPVLGLAAQVEGSVDVTLLDKTYTRATGAPTATLDRFPALPGTATLTVLNLGDVGQRVSSAVIKVNGDVVFGPGDFNQQVAKLQAAVAVGAGNELSVTLAGRPGAALAIAVTQLVDADAALVVGPRGASLAVNEPESPVYGVSVAVPPGAVTDPILLRISRRTEVSSVQPVFTFEPTGLSFAAAVEIGLPFNAEVDDADVFGESLSALTFVPSELRWKPLEMIRVDEAANRVTCSAWHFSDFTVEGDRFVHETKDVGGRLGSARSVVLVHGVQMALMGPRGDSDETFQNLKTLLRGEGYDVWSFEYATAQWIELSAGSLANGLKKIGAQKSAAGYPGEVRQSIVAHSMGGLVARTYMQNFGLKRTFSFAGWVLGTENVLYTQDVDRLFMLGTPNYGSVAGAANVLLDLIGDEAIIDLLPLPPFLKTLVTTLEDLRKLITGDLLWSSIEMTNGSDFLERLNNPTSPYFDLPRDSKYVCVTGQRYWSAAAQAWSDGVVLERDARLRGWEGRSGYDVTWHSLDVTHTVFPPVLGEPGIAGIYDTAHPTWPIVKGHLLEASGPGGRLFYLNRPNQTSTAWSIWETDLDRQASQKLTDLTGFFSPSDLVVSSDGRRLAFWATLGGLGRWSIRGGLRSQHRSDEREPPPGDIPPRCSLCIRAAMVAFEPGHPLLPVQPRQRQPQRVDPEAGSRDFPDDYVSPGVRPGGEGVGHRRRRDRRPDRARARVLLASQRFHGLLRSRERRRPDSIRSSPRWSVRIFPEDQPYRRLDRVSG